MTNHLNQCIMPKPVPESHASGKMSSYDAVKVLHVVAFACFTGIFSIRLLATPAVFGASANTQGAMHAGVRLATGEELRADLVVDCSGHRAHARHWLKVACLTEDIFADRCLVWCLHYAHQPAPPDDAAMISPAAVSPHCSKVSSGPPLC